MNENQKTQKDTAQAEVSLWSIVGLLLRKIHWLIATGLAFGIGVYLVLSLLVTPTFESRVTFYVYNNSGGASQSGSIDKSDLQAAESLATTYSKILESNSVLNAVLSDLNSALTRKELAQMVDVAVVTNTQLLEVVITSTDANFACNVAESFASVAPAEIVRITKAGGVEVVDHPEVATEQASPRTAFDTAIAVVVGVIIAAVIIILKTLSDTTIYLPEDIEKLVGVAVIGQIPEIEGTEKNYKYWELANGGTISYETKKIRQNMKNKSEIIASNRKRLLNNDTPFAIREAYVKLRTGLMFCMTKDRDRACKTIAVTSANPSEGKSLTAANIAISYAMLGKKTLLIDADLRKPTQRRLWKLDVSSGLCDFIAGIWKLELVKVKDLPLWIIGAGTIPPNPSELLSSDRMKTFVAEIATRYDYVIIDTPPINTVADAQILSAFVDGVLIVAKSGTTTSDELRAAVDAVERAEGNLCGVVLNDLNMKSMRYSYKYKYGGKYGDKYGYKYSYADPYERR